MTREHAGRLKLASALLDRSHPLAISCSPQGWLNAKSVGNPTKQGRPTALFLRIGVYWSLLDFISVQYCISVYLYLKSFAGILVSVRLVQVWLVQRRVH